MSKKIIVIGAGVIGLHCAWYLNQAGFEVEVIEAASENNETGCSYGNCGLLVPSHFVPLASPEMLRSGLKMMLDRTSPVYLPPGKNISSLPWFLKFMKAANKKAVTRAIPTLYKLNDESRKLYEEFSTENNNQSGFTNKGLLMAATTEKGLEEEIALAGIANDLGIETQLLDQQQLKTIEPEVDLQVAGAVLYKSDGNISPEGHLRWLKSYIKQKGVGFRYDTSVSSFQVEKGKIIAVETSFGKLKADEFVLATGAYSAKLAGSVGVKVPVIAGKGYSFDLQKDSLKLQTPLILTEAKVALTPFDDTVRLGSGMEFNGTIGEISYKRIQAIINRTQKALPNMEKPDAKKLNIWEGLRPVTPTGVPIIGRTNKYNNLLVATGHAMMGVSLGPITGKIISQLAAGEKPDFDMELMSI
ncbi:FAD-dependent oxidoreductase [uncultured Draconibacterium sp.]|uniref:NAD(P)/FAD-dependent oxidoreductase n=1 Tax=uncultured Draconibacterium sp. TaxID=1573823 RepID=UPI0029C6AB35|nr:FAD-dependent oxidoreductase [uncultured Draconibacterium sp.]